MIENLHGRLGPGNMTESDLWISDIDGVVGDAHGDRFDAWARRWSAWACRSTIASAPHA